MSQASTPTGVAPQSENAAYPNGELAQICGEVAAVFRRAWGRGPAKTTAHWAGPNMLVVVLANGHTDAEKTMRAAGHIQELLGGRRLLHVLVEPDLKASVERILGADGRDDVERDATRPRPVGRDLPTDAAGPLNGNARRGLERKRGLSRPGGNGARFGPG